MTTVPAAALKIVLRLIKHNTTENSLKKNNIRAEYKQIMQAADHDHPVDLLAIIVCLAFMRDHTHSYNQNTLDQLHLALFSKVEESAETTVFVAMLEALADKYEKTDFVRYFSALYRLRKNIILIDTEDQKLHTMLTAQISNAIAYFLANNSIVEIVFTDLGGYLGTALAEHLEEIESNPWEFIEDDSDDKVSLKKLLEMRRLFSFAKAYTRPRMDIDGLNLKQTQNRFAAFDNLCLESPSLIQEALTRQQLSAPFIIEYFVAERATWLFDVEQKVSLFTAVLDKVEMYIDSEASAQHEIDTLKQFPSLITQWTSSLDFTLLEEEELLQLQESINRVPIIFLKIAALPNSNDPSLESFYQTLLELLTEFIDIKLFLPSFVDQYGQSFLHALFNCMEEKPDNKSLVSMAAHLINVLLSKGVDISLVEASDKGDFSVNKTIFAKILVAEYLDHIDQYMYDLLETQQQLSQQQALLILGDVLPNTLLQPIFVAMHELIATAAMPLVYNGYDSTKLDRKNLLSFIDILVGFVRMGDKANQELIDFFALPRLWQDIESCSQTLSLLRRYQLPLAEVLSNLEAIDKNAYLKAVCFLVWSKATAKLGSEYNVFQYLAQRPDVCARVEDCADLQEVPADRNFYEEVYGTESLDAARLDNENESLYTFYASNDQVVQAIYRENPTNCAFTAAEKHGNEHFFLLFLSKFEHLLLQRNVPFVGVLSWDPMLAQADRSVKQRITDCLVTMCKRGVNINNILDFLRESTGGLSKTLYWGFDNQLLRELDQVVNQRRASMLLSKPLSSSEKNQGNLKYIEDHFGILGAQSEPPNTNHGTKLGM